MRFVPSFLQPILVWLVPAKWRLRQGWKDMERFVVPEVHRRSRDMADNTSSDLISWMVRDGSTAIDADPVILTRLVGAVAAGGTYSTANFVSRVVSDLRANPEVLAAVRQEIRSKDAELGGRANWDFSTYARLEKLESVMKETSRLAPGSLLVYSRVLQGDASLAGGEIELKKGQFVTVSSHNHSIDPAVFPDPYAYKGLRFYDNDRTLHRAPRPFHSLDGDILTWGAGRWACPGRFIATIAAKVLLVKILDEYDFEFYRGREPPNTVIHEFGFWHPSNKMRVRRRRADC